MGNPKKAWEGTPNMNDDSNNTHQRRKGLKSWFKRTDTRRIAEQAPVSSTSSHHVFWPEEYLVPDLPGACIWTYGYNVDVFSGYFKRTIRIASLTIGGIWLPDLAENSTTKYIAVFSF
jgi:hypothetical protein